MAGPAGLVGLEFVILDGDGVDVVGDSCDPRADSRDAFIVDCDLADGVYQPHVRVVEGSDDIVVRECTQLVEQTVAPITSFELDESTHGSLIACRFGVGPPSIRVANTVLGGRDDGTLVAQMNPIVTSLTPSVDNPECVIDSRLASADSSFGVNLVWCFPDVGSEYSVTATAPPGGYTVRTECQPGLDLFRGDVGATAPPIVVSDSEPFWECKNVLDSPFAISVDGNSAAAFAVSFTVYSADRTDVTDACIEIRVPLQGEFRSTYDCLGLPSGDYIVEFSPLPDDFKVSTSCDEAVAVGPDEHLPGCDFFAFDPAVVTTDLPATGTTPVAIGVLATMLVAAGLAAMALERAARGSPPHPRGRG